MSAWSYIIFRSNIWLISSLFGSYCSQQGIGVFYFRYAEGRASKVFLLMQIREIDNTGQRNFSWYGIRSLDKGMVEDASVMAA